MTDAEIAAEYRAKVKAILSSLCELIDKGKSEGFFISYVTGDDAQGRHDVTKIDILKRY